MTDRRGWLVSAMFAAVLGATVLLQAADVTFELETLSLVFVGFSVCAVTVSHRLDDRPVRRAVAIHGVLGLAVAWIALRQLRGGIPAAGRTLHVGVAFLAIVGFPLAVPGSRRFVRANLLYVIAFLSLIGGYLVHVPTLPPGSGRAGFAVITGLILGVSLLVVPRYVPRRAFLWLVAGLGGAAVLAGLPGYLGGGYELGPLTVRPWGASVTYLGVSTGVAAMRSFFDNPNTLGIVAFAGTIAGTVLLVDMRADRAGGGQGRPRIGPPAAGLLGALGLLGVLLSGSRASLLAAGAGLTVSLAGALGGPRGRQYGLVAVVAAVGLGLWAVASGLLPVNPGNRFALWRGSVAAIVRGDLLFGHGLGDNAAVIEPYLTEPAAGHSPHNAYLSKTIHAGLVGGIAHLLLAAGNVVDGAFGLTGDRPVDPGALALATGFALHMLFESYSLFGFWTGSVLAAVAAGYVLASRAGPLPISGASTFRWERVSRPPEPARPP